MNAIFSALVSLLLLAGATAQAQDLSREQAKQALSKADTPMRRDAALVVRMKITSVVATRAPSLTSVTNPSFQAVRNRLCTSG